MTDKAGKVKKKYYGLSSDLEPIAYERIAPDSFIDEVI